MKCRTVVRRRSNQILKISDWRKTLWGFIYAQEKRWFDSTWCKLEEEYRNAGFDDDGIAAIHDYDWELFKKRRTYQRTEQEFPSDDIGDNGNKSTLFDKFPALLVVMDDYSWSGRYGWIETVDDPIIAEKLNRMSDWDKELLTLLAIDGYKQDEIAEMKGCSQQAISKRICRLKNILKIGL